MCNMVGIACGTWLLRACGGKPHAFLQWRRLRAAQVAKFVLVLAMFLAFDLLTFFTKAVLWVPTEDPIVVYRQLVLIFAGGPPAVVRTGVYCYY